MTSRVGASRSCCSTEVVHQRNVQMSEFGTRFRVIAPERRGHGHTPDLEGPLSYDVMSADMIGFLDAVVGGPAYLVGWSDGGVVGLLVAMARPDLVRKLVVIGANFDPSGLTPEAMEGFTTLAADSDDLAMLRESYQDRPAPIMSSRRMADRDEFFETPSG